MSLPAVLIRKSTGEKLKFAAYPREDMQPVEGLDPDLEWLLLHTPHSMPEYDSRYWILKTIQPDLATMVSEGTLDQLPNHPVHTGIRAYQTTYGTEKRPLEDIVRAIENAEEAANREVMTYRTNDKLKMLAIGILNRQLQGVAPSPEEQEILAQVNQFDVDIWKNDAEKKSKIEAVTAGQEVDIDAGWEKGETNGGA